MAEMQQNPEGGESFNATSDYVPDSENDDTVAFEQVEQNSQNQFAQNPVVEDSVAQNQVDSKSAYSESEEESLVENLGEVSDEDDNQYDIVDDVEAAVSRYADRKAERKAERKAAAASAAASAATSTVASASSYAASSASASAYDSTSADNIATDTFQAVTPKSKESKKSKNSSAHSALALFYSLFIFVIILAAAFFAVHWYFHDRVAPGVNFGDSTISQNLTGAQESAVYKAVQNAVNRTELVIKDDRGKTTTASLQKLGVKVNTKATVNAILNAKRDNLFTRIMPWIQKNVSLNAKRDDSKMDMYLLHKFVLKHDRAVPYSVVFNKESESFGVQDGVPGRTIETMAVREAVKKLIANPGKTVNVSVSSRRTDAPIKRDAAQKLADDLNKIIDKKLKFSNGDGDDFTVPKKELATWINVKADTTRRKLSYEIDVDKADSYLSQVLPKALNKEKVNQEDAINKEGKVIFTTMKGSNGVEITYNRSYAEKACDAWQNGEDFNVTLPAKVTKFSVEQKLVEMRIVVDKTTQTASVYKNDELVKTFPVCTGRTGMGESTSGTFFIYLRYASQDMRGRNFNGSPYLSPNVHWVSYYHGGEGFHTATWNYNGIATGDPANHGSHGCINMYDQDARWIYENCPRGTIVQVVGSTPDGPVRQQ